MALLASLHSLPFVHPTSLDSLFLLQPVHHRAGVPLRPSCMRLAMRLLLLSAHGCLLLVPK